MISSHNYFYVLQRKIITIAVKFTFTGLLEGSKVSLESTFNRVNTKLYCINIHKAKEDCEKSPIACSARKQFENSKLEAFNCPIKSNYNSTKLFSIIFESNLSCYVLCFLRESNPHLRLPLLPFVPLPPSSSAHLINKDLV